MKWLKAGNVISILQKSPRDTRIAEDIPEKEKNPQSLDLAEIQTESTSVPPALKTHMNFPGTIFFWNTRKQHTDLGSCSYYTVVIIGMHTKRNTQIHKDISWGEKEKQKYSQHSQGESV